MTDEHDEFEDFNPWDDEATVFARVGELTPARYACAACGQDNETELDLEGGYRQQYVEDCTVCCRPNLLRITVDPETLAVSLSNELEYDC